MLCSVPGECKTKEEVAGGLCRVVPSTIDKCHIIAISSTGCVYVPRRARACLREEPCGTWWCVTQTPLAALHMTGRASGGWKALKWLHSGKAGLQQLVKKLRRRKHFQFVVRQYCAALRSRRVQVLQQISAPTCLCADGHCDIMLSHYCYTTTVLLAPRFNTHTLQNRKCVITDTMKLTGKERWKWPSLTSTYKCWCLQASNNVFLTSTETSLSHIWCVLISGFISLPNIHQMNSMWKSRPRG